MATEEDIGMVNYIMNILKSQPYVMMSWGVNPNTVKTITRGLQFHVQGFKVKGTVKITYMPIPDLFRIDIFPDNDTPPIIYEEVFLDQLVSMIDEAVEKTENYEKRICDEHGFIRQT